MRKRIGLLVGVLALLALHTSAATLRVSVQDGVPVVRTDAAQVAAVVEPDHSLWVLVPNAKLETLDNAGLASTWQVEALQVSGGAGVRVGSPVPRAWGAVREGGENGGGWRLAVGLPAAAAGKESVLNLREGKQVVGAVRLVGIAGNGERLAAWAGRGAGDALVGWRDGTVALVAAAPVEKVVAEKPVKEKGAVPMFVAAPLVAVATPTVVREELRVVVVSPAVPYVAGGWVSFTLPAGWRWQGERAVNSRMDEEARRAMEQDLAKVALEGALATVGEVVSDSKVLAALPVPEESASTVVQSVAALLDPTETVVVPEYKTEPRVAGGADGAVIWPQVAVADWKVAWGEANEKLQQALRVCLGERADPLPVSVEELEKLKTKGGGKDGGHGGGHAWLEVVVASAHAAAAEAAPAEEHDEHHAEVDAKDKRVAPWDMAALVGCENSPQVMGARRDLARLALSVGRVQEALTQLALVPKRTAEGDLLRAIAEVLRRNPDAAQPLLRAIGNQVPALRPEARAWRMVANQQQGASGAALEVWPKVGGEKVLENYPPYLRLVLQRNLAEAMVAVSAPSDAQKYVDELAEAFAVLATDPSKTVPPWLERLQGLARQGGENEVGGLKKLAKAAEQTDDPATAWQAKYDFVKALEKRGDLPRQQVIAYLEELSMFWRGDGLEQQVLRTLGDLRLQEGDAAGALASWETLVKNYPNEPAMAEIAGKMRAALVAAFDPEAERQLQPLEAAGLYYDFRELIPEGQVGDKLVERVADALTTLGLADRAQPLLETLLNYKLRDDVDTARVALKLANVLGQVGQDAERLKLLDAWKKVMVGTVAQRQWQLQEAEAYLHLKRYDRALASLNGMTGEDVEALRAKVAWAGKNWGAANTALGGLVNAMTPVSTSVPAEALQLAFARGALDDGAGIGTVAEKFREALEQDKTAGTLVAALAAQAGVKQTGLGADNAPLGRIARVLSDLNALEQGVQKSRLLAKDEAVEREEYNDKMRYIELLPPPAL